MQRGNKVLKLSDPKYKAPTAFDVRFSYIHEIRLGTEYDPYQMSFLAFCPITCFDRCVCDASVDGILNVLHLPKSGNTAVALKGDISFPSCISSAEVLTRIKEEGKDSIPPNRCYQW